MTEKEFGRLTFTQADALFSAWKNKQRREELRTARVAWILAETNRNKKKKPDPFKLEDFMSEFPGDAEERELRAQRKAAEEFKQLANLQNLKAKQNG